MVEIINLNGCQLSPKNGTYGGLAGDKAGIIYDNQFWMVKFPKNIKEFERTGGASYSTAPLCEFIGSQIYQILGYDVHETFLAEYKEKLVVVCKDFALNKTLLEIRTIKNFMNEELSEKLNVNLEGTGSQHTVDIDNLLLHLEHNPILKNIDGITERFFEQIVVDIFINNTDRNNGNWGILRDKFGNDALAPVFDNGGCLQSKISEEKIVRLLKDIPLVQKNACLTNTAYSKNGHMLSTQKLLVLFADNPNFQQAILKVVPIIQNKMDEITHFISSIPCEYGNLDVCSENRKKFYTIQLDARLNKVLIPEYQKIMILQADYSYMPEDDELER